MWREVGGDGVLPVVREDEKHVVAGLDDPAEAAEQAEQFAYVVVLHDGRQRDPWVELPAAFEFEDVGRKVAARQVDAVVLP